MIFKSSGLLMGVLALGLVATAAPASAESRIAGGLATVGGAGSLVQKASYYGYRGYGRGYRSYGYRSGYRGYNSRRYRGRGYYGYRSYYRPYYRGYYGGFRGHSRGFRFNRP